MSDVEDKDNDIVSRIMEQSGVGEDERAGMGESDSLSGTKSVEKQSGVTDDEGDEEPRQQQQKPDVNNDGTKQKAQPQQKPNQQQQQHKKPEPLVDENKQVIANGGAERRLFEKYKRAAEVDLPILQREINAYKEAANFSKYELNAQEAITGYSLVKAWKEDPAKLIKHLITQAKTAGISVDLGGGAQAGIDTEAVRAIIAEQMRPLSEARQQREQMAEANAQAEEQYNAFVEQFPDATIQEEAIAALITKDPDMTPREAYYAVKSFIAENGLSWNIPLKDQRATGGKQTPVHKQQPGMPRTRQTVVVQNDDADDNSEPVIAPASSSWSDIVKSSMKEAGYYK